MVKPVFFICWSLLYNKTSPFEFFQYWRNVDDADVLKCLRMLTFLPLEEIDAMSDWKDNKRAKEAGDWYRVNPHRLHLGTLGLSLGAIHSCLG